MTKILNSYGDSVDDYKTAIEWAKKAPWKDIPCKLCEEERKSND